jgi:hypothetical protein
VVNLVAYMGREGRITVNGGRVLGSIGGVIVIPQQDIRPALNSTTYIFLDLSTTPALATSTDGFPASSYFPIATVTTDGRGTITAFSDSRPDADLFLDGWGSSSGTRLSSLDYNPETAISTVQDVNTAQAVSTAQDVNIGELGWLDKLKAFFKPRRNWMKITLEIPDQTQAPKPATKSAPDTPAPAMSPETPEIKSPKAATEKRDAVLPGNRAEQQPKVSEDEPSQTAMGDSSMRSFDLQGGRNVISDPQRQNPNVFRFVAPQGDAWSCLASTRPALVAITTSCIAM